MSSWRAMITVRQKLGLSRHRTTEMFVYFSERWNRMRTYRSKLKYDNRVSCNEIICLIITNNFIPITKIYVGNEDNYATIAVGLWTHYRVYPGIRHVFYILTSVLELSHWHISGIFLLKSAELEGLKVEREKQANWIFFFVRGNAGWKHSFANNQHLSKI